MKAVKNKGAKSVIGLSLLLLAWAACSADNNGLSVTAKITNGTCRVAASPVSINFDPVYMGRLSSVGATSQILPVTLVLSECNGLGGGGEQAAIQVEGQMAQFDSALFLDQSGTTAKGVGVMLRPEKYTGNPSDFYNPLKAVRSGDYTYNSLAGKVPENGTTLDYSVGLTTGNHSQPVAAGEVTSTLRFIFLYH
ncbi:TPA: type 1 fimbrial protein [Serratia liquefaciens]|uniref:fimbrial protein n=1 Tax=Serratia proteamaculans TaxID=28151 RepID=UPI002178CE80|nr:fimbrial protein [Serratia proteamaculans]CAI1209559.1 P pilus assembly protein, pilin FimA [Serratia proteamaculans]HEJ7885195.1 type 1 fimbrial protein [Serratia liquefaciens]